MPARHDQAMKKNFNTDAARWIAVQQRDERASDAFVYAVKTTGVCCRPGCGSRLANRENVEFFNSCDEAERSGYRACKKCKPNVARDANATSIIKACAMIDQSNDSPKLDEIAAAVGLSPHYFHRVFKKQLGITPKAYAIARQSERMRERLPRESTVTKAIYSAGFKSSSRFYESAEKNLGMKPARFKQGGRDEKIRFTIVECDLGWVAIAATDRGVCAIELGDSSKEVQHQIESRFSNAQITSDDIEFNQWVRQVLKLIENPRHISTLPLDIQGTAFQKKVWDVLSRIPVGQTTNYAAIAKELDRPRAVRAVASACAQNQLAIAIPCHRVIKSNGDLSGYRWSSKRKQKLLELESRH
ncbi:MAG TPA: bifunctional DNA-binding transcriptional regulator/O6-methylguanine-DNA methyltransferase Ada [Tepidisphaeraceae bacterium]|nr:bifunctional DNA-binding transcriptional regulator/O6-methylguanine-DNA methyltransferase Ada [Tepidisphaeraceae bacterium]